MAFSKGGTTQTAIRWRSILAGLLLLLPACGEDLQSQKQQEVSQTDPLWVAIVRNPGRAFPVGALIPTGRYDAGAWDQPWPEILDYGSLASIDSARGIDVRRSALPPVDNGDPERLRIDAPLEWSFYTDAGEENALTVAELALERAHCVLRWALYTDAGDLSVIEGTNRIAGVAFSRRAHPISADVEIPNLDSIQVSLGLVGNERTDDGYRNFVWLGFYRLEDGSIIGVVNDQGYEGESYKVITFRDEQSRVVVDVYGGGC